MEFLETEIEDVIILKPSVFTDERGYFFESYRRSHLETCGMEVEFVQDNVSCSQRDTLRGLHYQIENQQDKLVMVLEGEILDVAVDLRRSSPTFGKAVSRVLSSENRHQLFVPRGFAHGFLVYSEKALVHYKCSDYYNPAGERGLKWDDPSLNLKWDVESPIVSEKDRQQPLLADIPEEDLFS